MTLKKAIENGLEEIYKRNFSNYERRIRKWAEKGIRKERF
jgi:hypothetical protein